MKGDRWWHPKFPSCQAQKTSKNAMFGVLMSGLLFWWADYAGADRIQQSESPKARSADHGKLAVQDTATAGVSRPTLTLQASFNACLTCA
eukprot:1142098-Pelagomonas_calceolata.AAC.4